MTVYTTDTFNRTNSTTNLGSTDGAGSVDPLTWTQNVGTWGINSNQAYTSASTTSANATVDTTKADVTVKVTLATLGSFGGLAFRLTNSSNYWFFAVSSTAYTLAKVVSGSQTTLANTSATFAANDVLKVVTNGSSISIYRNDTRLTTATDSFNSTATKHGLYNSSSTTTRFDSFEVDNPSVILNVTQTETIAITKALTLTRATITATNTETPTRTTAQTRSQTISVTQVETPTDPEDLIPGIQTTATGPEATPTYVIKTVGMVGDSAATLTLAEPDSVTWTLNQPDEFEFHFPKNAYTDTDVVTVGNASSGVREVQIYRNSDLLTWGPVIGLDAAGNDGKITCKGAGVDWYLNRRFVDGPIPNLLSNADFESGTSNWTSNGGVTFSVVTNQFETGSHAAKLVSSSGNADTHIRQTVSAGPNGVGLLVTLSAWFYIESFTAPAFGFLGLYMEGYKNGVFQANNWYPIDSATPRDTWKKTNDPAPTLWIPPGETWQITVKLYGPQGTIYWDDVKLVAMNSLSTGVSGNPQAPMDIGQIANLLVGFEQQTVHGKSDLHIGVNAEHVGVSIAKTWQFVDHTQFDQALKELTERKDGSDYGVDYTPTTRTFHMYAHKRGTDRTGSVTLTYNVSDPTNSNCTDYRWSRDGGAAITRSVVLGEDNGPDREQGEAADATNTGGVILQDVKQAPQNSKTSSLQPLADETIDRFGSVPITVEMDVIGASGLIPTLKLGDQVNINIHDGYVSITSGNFRIQKLHLDCVKNILTVSLAHETIA